MMVVGDVIGSGIIRKRGVIAAQVGSQKLLLGTPIYLLYRACKPAAVAPSQP